MSEKLTDAHLNEFINQVADIMSGWTCVKGKLGPVGSRAKEVPTYCYTDTTGRRVEFEVYGEATFTLMQPPVAFLAYSLHDAEGVSEGKATSVSALKMAFKKIRDFRR